MDGWAGGWVDGWFAPIFPSLGGLIPVSTAGGPEPSPGEGSGDSEQTEEDGELDTVAQAQPLGSKVSLPQSPRPSPTWSLGLRFPKNLSALHSSRSTESLPPLPCPDGS